MKSVNIQTKEIAEVEFPKGLLVENVNKSIIAQAVRVYLTRLRQGNANTKTRGEVVGSRKKIYKQKGTGRARHGNITAPVFVGGGIVHGPRTHSFDLKLPVAMKRVALVSALNSRKDELFCADAVADYSAGTKGAVEALNALTGNEKKTLIVIAQANRDGFRKAVENIKHVQTIPADDLNALHVLTFPNIIVEKAAWEVLEQRIGQKKQTSK